MVVKWYDKYHICVNGEFFSNTLFVSNQLSMNEFEYKNILLNCGGKYCIDCEHIAFDNKEDVQRALSELEPWIVMITLTE